MKFLIYLSLIISFSKYQTILIVIVAGKCRKQYIINALHNIDLISKILLIKSIKIKLLFRPN